MPGFVGFLIPGGRLRPISPARVAAKDRGLPLERQGRAKSGTSGLGAVCILLLIGSVSVRGVFAQSETPDHASPAKKTTATKAAASKANTASSVKRASAHRTTTARPTAGVTHASTPSHASVQTHAKSSASSSPSLRSSKYNASKRRSGKKVARGQQKIEPERAEAIQQALIREHYLSGNPAGTWNQESEDAMRRYQADHGWQSKTVPDARALIKLGLGPSHDHLLNPESAMTTAPDAPRATSLTPTSHSADPGSHVNSNAPAPADPAPAPSHDAPAPQ